MSEASFREIAQGVWVYAIDGGTNSGAVIGSNSVMVYDCPGDPAHAADFAERLRAVTPHRVKYAIVSHYHASRWSGLDVFPDVDVITTRKCNTAMLFRGGFEPQVSALRKANKSAAAITSEKPAPDVSITFKTALSLVLGDRKVDLLHFGPGHTTGDAVLWVQDADVMFAGDLVEVGVAPFLGDASFSDWIEVLDKLAQYNPAVLIPGRGAPGETKTAARDLLMTQRAFIDGMWRIGGAAATDGRSMLSVLDALEREAPAAWLTLPEWRNRAIFAASRIHDAANGVLIPQIWTPERFETLQEKVEAAFS